MKQRLSANLSAIKGTADVKDGQKSVGIRFKPLPQNPKDIERLCQTFVEEKRRQTRTDVSGFGFVDEKGNVPKGIESLSFTIHPFRNENPLSIASLGDGPYIYGMNASGQEFVIGKLDNVSALAAGAEATLSSGDYEVRATLFAGGHTDGSILMFEGADVILPVRGEQCTLKWDIAGGFRKRYRTARLVGEILRTGELYADGKRLFKFVPCDESDLLIKRLDETAEKIAPIIETVDGLGLAAEWDPEEMTRGELDDLGFLHRACVEKKPIKHSPLESPLVHVDIQGAQVFLVARQNEEGLYEFTSFNSDRLFFAFSKKREDDAASKEEFFPVPALLILQKRNYLCLVDLDPQRLSEQFERFPVNAGNAGPLNPRLLEMLAAYDEGALQPQALLACAAMVARRLYDFDRGSEVGFVNLAQTLCI